MFDASVQSVIDKVDALRHEVDDHWQVPADEAKLLAQIVRMSRCVSLCEIGVSYGFSTLHLAGATAALGGHMHAVDISAKKIAAARSHLQQAGLDAVVTLHEGDAREVVSRLQPEQPFDFVFIDAVKEQSDEYLDAVLPKLARRAVIVTDNTVSHAKVLAPFVARLRAIPNATSCEVRVGNGFELTVIGD
jgi:predicted O-methyltransferase YrrM